MDFARSPTQWIGGRCYRILNSHTSGSTTNYAEDDTYPCDDAVYEDDPECAMEQEEFQVERLDNGRFISSFPVASSYISYLIGAKGATKRRIENETYTTLRFPGKGQSGDVVVTGRDVKTVRQARIKLEMLVAQARKRQSPTHFLSIPCNTQNIQDRFNEFKKELLEKCGTDRGVEESLFIGSAKLHMTVCMMVLADERERQNALEVLTKCPQDIIKQHLNGEKLQVEIRGIEIMNDDPGEVNVLYARINPISWSHSLQGMADDLAEEFVKKGIARKEFDRVKLHMTLMNTRYRNNDDDDESNKPRETFCARRILEEFKDYKFGAMEVEEIHLSVRHTTSADGYYTASGTIPVVPF